MMRSLPLALVGLFSTTALGAVACGSSVANSGSESSAGGGGGGSAISSGATMPAGSGSNAGGGNASSSSSASSSVTSGAGAGYPAPHPPMPQVVNTGGGPVLAAPKIYPVFFANDDPTYVTKITDFFSKANTGPYWAANTLEYAVGPFSVAAPIKLPQTASGTMTDAQVQTWLKNKLNGNDPAFPKPDQNTLITLVYPAGVTITQQGAASCVQFGGYHNNVTLDAAHNNLNVAYIVSPRCANFDGITGVDAVTAAMSHEMIEAVTDPYPQSLPAFQQVDEADLAWAVALGGTETGDMCAQSLDSFGMDPAIGYTVQRSWSNKAAAASHEPCVPAPAGEVYFNSAPVLNDVIPVAGPGTTYMLKGVNIPVGQSKTVELDLFSDGKTAGPWTVDAKDLDQLKGGSPTLQFSFDKTSGVNGDKLQMTIKVTKQNQNGGEIFFIISTLGAKKTLWVGLVAN